MPNGVTIRQSDSWTFGLVNRNLISFSLSTKDPRYVWVYFVYKRKTRGPQGPYRSSDGTNQSPEYTFWMSNQVEKQILVTLLQVLIYFTFWWTSVYHKRRATLDLSFRGAKTDSFLFKWAPFHCFDVWNLSTFCCMKNFAC
jgi:hypothetical protein